AKSSTRPATKPTGPIGSRIERKEDARFLTGAGQETDDVTLLHQIHVLFVRSPYADAKVRAIKTDAAEEHPGQLCCVTGPHLTASPLGDKAATDAAFAKAAHVTTLDFINNRLIPHAIEPRACNAAYHRADESYTLYVSNQNPHVERLLMTAFVLGLPEHKVRVIAPDVGGGFGSKIYLYAEETVCVWASKLIGRPIKWTAERSESFLSAAHRRDH